MLQEGDIIELKEGHKVYAMVRKCDVYSNRQDDTSLTSHDVTIGGKYSSLAGRYVVYHTQLQGGGTGHGPHDVFPDGHRVFCRKIDEEDETEVDFYQSGCFTAMIKDIEPVGNVRYRWVED